MPKTEPIQFYELIWSRPITLDEIIHTLTNLATLSGRGTVVWEVRVKKGEVKYFLGTYPEAINKVHHVFQTFGKVQFSAAPVTRIRVEKAVELKINRPLLALNTDTAEATIRASLAAMCGDHSDKETVLQLVLGKSFSPRTIDKNTKDPTQSWLSLLLNGVENVRPETQKAMQEKANLHAFLATVRVGAEESTSTIRNVVSGLKTLESTGTKITMNPINPDYLGDCYIPWFKKYEQPELSTKEVSCFMLLPIGASDMPGNLELHPKMLLPPAWYKSPSSSELGSSEPDSSEPNSKPCSRTFAKSLEATPRDLSISPKDSLLHTFISGPTGSGKSTVFVNLILQDINLGMGTILIDPKQDLVSTILERMPEHRKKDVVILDPADECPVGLNPLNIGSLVSRGEDSHNPELVADTILAVLKQIFADSWGIRTQDVLSAALLTLVHTKGATMLHLLPLLTDPVFRLRVLNSKKIRENFALMQFWSWYDSLSERERNTIIAPVQNKLRNFVLRKGLRSVLGQANPKFSLTEIFTKRKILLIPLNKAIIGETSARLLGSLVVGLIWALALSRAEIAPEKRQVVSLYIDEMQSFISGISSDLTESLAQARGLGLSLHLATQYLEQLSPALRSAVDANCRNKIYFGQNSEDARELAKKIPELEAQDFLLLPRYQVYTTFNVNGRNTGFIRGQTLPPPPASENAAELKAESQKRYGEDQKSGDLKYFASLNTQTTQTTQSKKTDNLVDSPVDSPTPNNPPIGRRCKDD